MSYSRSSYRASSSSYRFSSEGGAAGGDEGFTSSYKSTSRTGTGTGSRLSRLDSDDIGLSTTRRNTRPREESFESTSSSRVSGRLYDRKDSDDDFSTSKRIASRTASRTEDSGSYSRKYSRGLSADLDSSTGVDSYLSTRKTSRSHGLDDSSNDYLISKKTSRDYGEESSSTTRKYSGRIYAALEDDLDTSGSGIASTIRSSRITSKLTEDENYGLSATTKRGLSRLGSTEDDGLAIGSGGLTASGRYKRSESQESSLLYRQSSNVSDEGSFKSSNRKRSLDRVDSYKSYKASALDEDRPVSPSFRLKSRSSTINEENIYVAVLDYSPPKSAQDEIELKEGQEVIVLNKDKPHKWKVQTRPCKQNRISEEGFVPSCYLEQKTPYDPSHPVAEDEPEEIDPKIEEAKKRRKNVLKELVETEEDFNRDMQFIANTYLKHMDSSIMPKELRDQKVPLFGCFKEIADFHNDVLMKGVQYYAAEDPSKVGNTFLRLERDFDKHVRYCHDLPQAQKLLESGPLKDYFDNYSSKIKDDKSLADHLKLPVQRINDYQLLLKELIKYSNRLGEDSGDLCKALELMRVIPQRATDLQFINNMIGYKGNLHKSGRLLKHDWFQVIQDESSEPVERYVFLFTRQLITTDVVNLAKDRQGYVIKTITKLEDVNFEDVDDLTINVQHKEPGVKGFPFKLQAKTAEIIKSWKQEIQDVRKLAIEELADIPDPEISDDGTDCLKLDDISKGITPEPLSEDLTLQQLSGSQVTSDIDTKVGLAEDLATNDGSNTVMTESLRSGSVTDIEACDLEAKPVFRQPLKPVNQHVGEKAVLECQVKSALPVNVTWLKDNAKLRESENVQFITSSDKFILTIDGITNDDSGLYTVIASNDKGKTSSSAALNVKQDSLKPDSRPTTPGGSVLPHPPKFKIKLKDTELLEGTTVRFEMIVRGLPIPNVTFYKDDKPLITDDRVRIIYENKEIFELFIDHVKPEDAGVYKAIAINTHGEDSTSGKVTITKHKDIFKGLEDDHFLGEPESLDISRADSRSSRPRTPAFRWFKDGQEFEASERFQCTFDDEEDTIALIFQHVTPDDAGLYTCVASTSSGKISCSAELSVQGEVRKLLREPEKPAVKVPISDIEVNEGASAMLEAKITGYPKPLITWYKDNEEIKVDEKYKFLYEDEESYTLVIKGVRRDDASKYRLKASNDLGEVETSGQLTVNSAPKVKRELKDQSVMTDEPMTLDVVVEGTPTPTAKWFKDGQPVKLDDRVKIVDKDETHSLVIDPVKLEDAGNYTCIVSNSCGQQTGQSVVTVNSPPKFQLGLKDVSAKDGDTIEFKVKVSGNPEPEVVLMKDGKKLDRQISTEKEAEVYRFKIRSTTVEDTGKYQCVAKNQYGSETSEGSLTIVTKPSFDKRLEDIECKEGDTNVDLKVKISGSPRPKVRWLLEEEEISQSSKRTEIIEEEDGVFILRIKEASLETAGKYTIVAVNSEGEVRSSGIVDVKKDESKQYDQRKPVFGQKLRDLEALETDLDVTFKASIEEPDKTKITSIRWYIDDIEITESDRRFKIMSDDSIGVFKLVVRRPDESVEGKYKLIVENPYGYDETNASFTIMREPKFIKKLRDKDIDVNDKLTLTVKVDGVPEPTLTWFKDEQEITKISEKVVIGKIDDAYSLTIDSAQSVDEGVYKCSAKNKIGEDSTSARITVLSPPNFTKGLTDISVSADLDLTLEVQVTGADKVEWYKDGLKICEATSEADGITHRLPLKSVKLDDAGDYKAVARNAFGRVDSGTGHLTVKTENKEAPKFVEPLTDVAVQLGEDVTFTVKVTGSPTPKVIWSINGKEVTPSDHIIVSDLGNNTHSLTVKGSQTDDQASYSVSAVNDSGKAQDEAKLTIKVAAEKPKISGLKDIEIERGSTALIGCTVTGSPKPEVVWMKDGVKLSTGDEFEIISDSDTKHSIYVKKASESTQGTYIVSAKNIEGSSEADVKLTLIAEPPKFIKNLTDCSGSLGSELTLEAEVKGFPPPVVSWYKNGSELIESSEAFVSQVGTLNKLSLKDLKSSDAGEYTCKAENKAGEANSTAKISIEKPELIKGLPDSLNGKQGDVLKLEAKLSNDSTNEPIKWLKDGKEIPQNDRLKTKILPDGTLILTIEDAQPEDSGVYQVVVGNDGPNQVNSSSNVSVSPKEFVKPNVEPKFIEDLHDVSVKEGSPFKMEAKVTGHPKPEICWFKDDEPISPNPHCGFISEPDGTIGLMFDHCNGDDAGRYKAIATNSSGEVITTGKLTVDKPTMKPSFSADLSPVDVAEGQPLVLTGVVDGHPPPNIKWLKDGEEIKPNSRITMSQSPDGTVTLSINSASPDDEGKYTVAAANDEGRVRSSAPVSVRRLSRSLSKPSFDEGLKPTTLKAGEPTTLSVAVSGEPSPEVKWLKDGHPIEPDDRHHFTDKPPNIKCLTIDDVKPEDAGNYSVVAGNDLGEDKTSAPIKVNQSPRFVKPLDGNIEAVDGFPIKLEVKTEGEPKPELTWFKDGETIIPDGDRLRIINEPDGVSSLIITKTLPNDKGHYSCAAVNPLGTNKTEGDVSVGPTKKNDQAESIPRLIKNLSDCEVDEGKTMKFEAHIEGNPINEVKWFRNGEPLTIGSNIVPYFDGKRAGLEIRNCGPMDQGDYEVKLGNSLGTISSKSRGIVRSRDPPKFTQKLIDSTFGTKSPISLNCRVSGNPEPEVQWYHNGKLIEPGLKYQLKRESNLLSLIINNPTSNDGGTIECRATNPVGSDSTRCSIKVSDRSTKEEPAAFIKRFNEYECTEGQSAKFTACIVGNPKPELKWFKDGKDFEPTSRHLIDVETNGIVRLTIRNVEPADVGEYQLFISNPHGNDSSSAKLTIDNMDKKYRRRSMDVGKELSKRSGLPSGLLEKPRIIRMWDTGISLGWKPAIPSYSGIPVTYTLDWCKHPYSDSDWKPYRTGILDNRCDIRNLEPGQDYSFRVRVENKLGVSDPSPVVTAFRSKLIDPDAKPKDYEIERPPIDKIACAPRWLRKEDDEMYGIRGRPVTIIFWVYGYPEPDIKWFFNDIEIQIGTGNYDVMKDRNGKVCLFINRMTEKDVGTYSCHATNEHGEAWKKIKLLQAEPPSFILRLKETTGMAYKSTRMECKVTGIPMPTVKWFKDWLPIHDSDRTKILWEESENRSTLFINSTISRDAGLYSVTATNVVGSASCSANLAIEDDEILFNWANYIPRVIRPRKKALEDYYDLGDELGRGTQGVTYHAVERASGNNYAIKMMHGKEDTKPFMDRELEMMNQFFHPKLVRLWDAFDHKETLALITDICGGGELLEAIVGRGQLTEKEIANYIRQILEGLNHMHGREIGHFGLTIGDILLERIDGEDVKIADFSLSRRLIPGKSVILEYGHPEFVAPEIVNKQPISLAADLWSVGVLTYILLTGISPFLGQNDRETLSRLKEGKISFSHETFVHVSEDAKDFLSKLLIIDPTKRLDVKKALEHRWISGDSINHREDKLPCIDALKEYLKKWRDWYKNASCRKYYRRNPLDYCFEHPSKMIYPPDEPYKPSEPPVVDHKPKFKPSEMDDSVSPRPGYDPANFTSESQYQSGPDTYLLPHRDVDFPLRIREYLRVGASRSPSLANSLRSSHWGDTNLGIGQRCSPQVAVRERRRFVEVMDEEIEDERKGLDTRTVPMRLQHEIGTPGYAYGQIHQLKQEAALHLGRDVSVKIVPPFFREKIKDVVVTEGSIGLFSCFAVGEPKPTYTWFRNDGIIIESPRISVKQLSSGRVELTINPVHAYDAGCYKCVARNEHGAIFCRARLRIGNAPEKPEPPEVRGTSATEAYLVWSQPKGLGNSWITSYSLEYSIHGTNEWNILVDRLSQEFYLVRNLSPGTSYTFRVKAKNKFGWSEFSEPSEPSTTAPVGSDVRISLPRGQKEKLLIGETLTEAKWEELAAPDLDYSRERQPIEMKQGIEPTALYHTSSDEIARGHFSVIIKAACKETEKPLALKICLVENQASSGIMNEYEMLKSLCHERIVSLYSATCGSDTIALGMERLSGVDVLTYLSQSTVYSEDTVTRIIQQVLDGIEYLHFQGICMLELQPDNIVLINNHFPNIKLIDFANARHVPPNGTKVTIKGSPEYLAPEIIKREEVSTATDIWCVGILAYILLSGASPFKGETEEETIENVSYVRYHFDHLYKEVTQEAIRFLMLVFKRSPSKRPTIEECSDHKWLMPNEYAVRKRESTLFSSNKLAQFNENLRSDKSCSTPDKLLKILGIS